MEKQTVWVVTWTEYDEGGWLGNCDSKETALAYMKRLANERLSEELTEWDAPRSAHWKIEENEIVVTFVNPDGVSSFDETFSASPYPVITASEVGQSTPA